MDKKYLTSVSLIHYNVVVPVIHQIESKKGIYVVIHMKKVLINSLPEWENELEILKRKILCSKSESEILRYLIRLGIEANKEINNKNFN